MMGGKRWWERDGRREKRVGEEGRREVAWTQTATSKFLREEQDVTDV